MVRVLKVNIITHENTLELHCFSIFNLQSAVQYVKYLRSHERLRNLVTFGTKFLYPNDKKGKLAQILDKRADELMRKTAQICLAFVVASVLFVIYPFYLLIMEGTRPTPVPIIVPFFDPDTKLGYGLSLVHQFIYAVSGMMGNLCFEIFFSTIINNFWAAADIIQYSLENLPLEVHSVQERINRKRLITNILIQIQDVDW